MSGKDYFEQKRKEADKEVIDKNIPEKEKEDIKNEINEKPRNNIIIGEIEIKNNNLRQRIINSLENTQKDYSYIKGIENEEEIKNL